MNRTRATLAATALSGLGLLAVACSTTGQNASGAQQSAAQAEIEANRQMALAKEEARLKRVEADDAAREARLQAQQAETRAAEQRALALATFTRDKIDYKAQAKKELVSLGGQIDEMKAEIDRTRGAAKAEDNRLLAELTERQEQLEKDVASIDKATAADWPPLRARVNSDLDQFENDGARHFGSDQS